MRKPVPSVAASLQWATLNVTTAKGSDSGAKPRAG